MNLPSSADFLLSEGIASQGPLSGNGTGGLLQKPPVIPGVSQEFRVLLVQYCASTNATELASVNWTGLARRLGTIQAFLEEAANAIDQAIGADKGGIWGEVINERIKRASAAKVFRDNTWERLEQKAVTKLVDLMESNLIRDPGELLAIAREARRVNEGPATGGGGNHTSITINQGNGADPMMDANGLPPAGAKMTIDLSPRLATALQNRGAPVAPQGERVIDGEMISAKELRMVAEESTRPEDPMESQTDPAEEA